MRLEQVQLLIGVEVAQVGGGEAAVGVEVVGGGEQFGGFEHRGPLEQFGEGGGGQCSVRG